MLNTHCKKCNWRESPHRRAWRPCRRRQSAGIPCQWGLLTTSGLASEICRDASGCSSPGFHRIGPPATSKIRTIIDHNTKPFTRLLPSGLAKHPRTSKNIFERSKIDLANQATEKSSLSIPSDVSVDTGFEPMAASKQQSLIRKNYHAI